ncbi:hypothetical protein H920_13764 [Fukomys damarensis]|uniref:Uncharacterized protein n=1 Tax=Fukomys damarensis TaxID=885580 RepID=A0A091D3P5_FUKDA|nr:hypothetical protein H920_13764 [Fukomys damarensis]
MDLHNLFQTQQPPQEQNWMHLEEGHPTTADRKDGRQLRGGTVWGSNVLPKIRLLEMGPQDGELTLSSHLQLQCLLVPPPPLTRTLEGQLPTAGKYFASPQLVNTLYHWVNKVKANGYVTRLDKKTAG